MTEARYREAGKAVPVTDKRTDIITGEGVGLVLPVVTLGTRVISALIDYGLYSILAGAALYATWNVWVPANIAQVFTWITTALMVWAVALPFLVQWVARGSSLGRLLTGTRTVRYDGGTIGMRHALTRAVTGLFDIHLTMGALATVSIIATPRGQRPGDLLAGTIVVQWPRRYRGPVPLEVDARLERWALSATIESLPGSLSIAARDFLRRAKGMTPESRETRAREIAATMETYVAPPPPVGTDPEAFIVSVLSLRERADYERAGRILSRQSQTERRLGSLPYSVDSSPQSRRSTR